MSQVTTYNANDCIVTVNDIYITGLAETMIKGEKDEDFFSTTQGAQGDVVVNEINNTLGTITLTTQATSPQNKKLLKWARKREQVPVWITNKTLNQMFGGTKAQIKKFPSMEFGKEATDIEWEFQVFDYDLKNIKN